VNCPWFGLGSGLAARSRPAAGLSRGGRPPYQGGALLNYLLDNAEMSLAKTNAR